MTISSFAAAALQIDFILSTLFHLLHILRRIHAYHRTTILHVAGQQLHVHFHHFHVGQHNRMIALVQHGPGQFDFAVKEQCNGQIVFENRLGSVQRGDVPVCGTEKICMKYTA